MAPCLSAQDGGSDVESMVMIGEGIKVNKKKQKKRFGSIARDILMTARYINRGRVVKDSLMIRSDSERRAHKAE